MSEYVQRYWMGGAPQMWVVEAADYDKAAARIAYLESALKIIADGTICPDLFPLDTDENVIAAKTAMVTAIAALEHSESETKGDSYPGFYCPACKFKHGKHASMDHCPSPPSETPADYTIDGDGVWMDGKWHPSGGPKSAPEATKP